MALLLAALFILTRASTAAADGLILDSRPAGGAGPQLDAAVLSPLPAPRPRADAGIPGIADAGVSDANETYVVQAGDTLEGIATRLQVPVLALATANDLANPDQIAVGQVLRVRGMAAAAPALPAAGALTRTQLWPWPPAQGQTLAVWLQARQPVSLTVEFSGRAYPVVGGEAGRAWALIPIPALLPPGAQPLTVTAGAETILLSIPVEAGTFGAINIPAAVAQPILSQAARVSAEAKRLAQVFQTVQPAGWTARERFRAPLDGALARSSPFGTRRTYGDSPTLSAHEGEDFSAAAGAPVYAPAAGTVALAETLFVRGNAVILDHGHGVYTGYWHLSRIDVAPGETIAAGQQIGAVGNTGLSTGAHLHWELRVNGVAVDPLQWLETNK